MYMKIKERKEEKRQGKRGEQNNGKGNELGREGMEKRGTNRYWKVSGKERNEGEESEGKIVAIY